MIEQKYFKEGNIRFGRKNILNIIQ